MMKKRLLAAVLALAMMLCAGSAMAETFDIGTADLVLTDACGDSCQGHEITGTTTEKKISVAGKHDVTLNGVSIDLSVSDGCAFSIASGAEVNLMLKGTNVLKSGATCAGLNVDGGAKLTIYGQNNDTDTIKATGGSEGAGIGGGYGSNGGTITIRGGMITAQGGYRGAGIGGGELYDDNNVAQGTVTIEGGTVNATGGSHGAGIGSGEGGNATVTISGGTVNATGGSHGAGIGSGYNGGATVIIQGGTIMKAEGGTNGAAIGGHNGSATVIILGGSVNVDPQKVDHPRDGMSNEVFLHTLTLDGAADGTPVESVAGAAYGVNDVKTIGDKLYFWLTENSGISEMSAGGVKYRNDGSGWFTMEKPDGGMPQDAQNLPQTGDPSMLSAWVCLLAASGAMGMKMRRKK